ncbi:UvrD-helicase domain-containing protein [Brevundimonas sp.]|uniref:UvrD-helicase domain-containing protein n=1 Tax=Brevundimonas sp. TaxID=1871086 RepID=UPI0025C23CDA|nr:UvrD-helicase domain-containing protein [Brevundimonas sp.]
MSDLSPPNPVDMARAHQATAADPALSVFVTANAGSGKTTTLVSRVARLLLKRVRPGEILCVTYTKAAAAEMQARLFERLGEWAVADDRALSWHRPLRQPGWRLIWRGWTGAIPPA